MRLEEFYQAPSDEELIKQMEAHLANINETLDEVIKENNLENELRKKLNDR